MEIWKVAVGWLHYKVSSFGRLRSLPHQSKDGRVWKSRTSCPKRRFVKLRQISDGVHVDVNFCRLMLVTFTGPPPSDISIACHKDDDITNNRISNLYWGTHSSNARDAFANGKSFISEEQKRKISLTLMGHSVSDETRSKLRIAATGKKQSPESIAKKVAKTSGDNHWTRRKGFSETSRKKMSESAKRRHCKMLPGEAVAPLPEEFR